MPALFSLPFGGGSASPGFNVNPSPHRGQGFAGAVPGPVGIPPSQYSQVGGVLPNLPNLTTGAGNVIGSELGGQLSQGTMDALKRASAEWGVGSGMGPGSGLETNKLFGNIAGFSENLQQQGINNLLKTVTGLGSTMTDPRLAFEVADRNALYAAAPDPAAQAQHEEELFNKYYGQSNQMPFSATWAGRNSPITLGPRPAGPGGVLPYSIPGGAGGSAGVMDETPYYAFNPSSPDSSGGYNNWAQLASTWGTSPTGATPTRGSGMFYRGIKPDWFDEGATPGFSTSNYSDADVEQYLNTGLFPQEA